MKVFILTSEDYHDNPQFCGVFSSLERAQSAHLKKRISGVIHIAELDCDVVESGFDHMSLNTVEAEVRDFTDPKAEYMCLG